MNLRRVRQILLWVTVGAAVSGCAGTTIGDALSSHFKSSVAEAPSALDSIPRDTGLVILDFKVVIKRPLGGDGELTVNGASIQRMKPGSEVLYSGPVSSGFFGGTTAGVLFQNLQPGQYQVTTLGAQRANPFQTFRFDVSKSNELAFNVEAGKPLYIGNFSARIDGKNISYSWQKERQRELKVWQIIKDKYSPSKWDTAIDEKITSLQGGG